MRVEYTLDGMLQVNLEDALNLLSTEQKVHLIDVLACKDDVIKYAADQIFDGLTENGSRGGIYHNARANPDSGLDYAMRQVALRADEVAKKEIERLQETLQELTDEFKEYRQTHCSMYERS